MQVFLKAGTSILAWPWGKQKETRAKDSNSVAKKRRKFIDKRKLPFWKFRYICLSSMFTRQCTQIDHNRCSCLLWHHEKKNSHILPTGQWYAPSAVNYSALSCPILHYLALSCTIMHYLALSFTNLHYLALSYTILRHLALSCTIMHYHALSCTILHYLALSCTIMHYLALSCTLLHYLSISCSDILLYPYGVASRWIQWLPLI